MKIGDKVHCTAYAERRKQGISVVDVSLFDEFLDREVIYYDSVKRETVYIPFKEFTDCVIDKFETIEKEFDGIYVGTTHLTTANFFTSVLRH